MRTFFSGLLVQRVTTTAGSPGKLNSPFLDRRRTGFIHFSRDSGKEKGVCGGPVSFCLHERWYEVVHAQSLALFFSFHTTYAQRGSTSGKQGGVGQSMLAGLSRRLCGRDEA